MALHETKDARALFMAAVMIVAVVVLSLSVVQGSDEGPTFVGRCSKMAGCTLDKCQQLCISLGHSVNNTEYDYCRTTHLYGLVCCCLDKEKEKKSF
ncbi:unnamed protein product [Urochloa humidicola]